MKIQSFSIIAGTSTCNASCPYCVSKMTGFSGVRKAPEMFNWQNFDNACCLAQLNQVSSVIITGKGEPTLYPEQITQLLERLQPYRFPWVELQTNGLAIDKDFPLFKEYLKKWLSLGLGLVAVSVVHYEERRNATIFTSGGKYMNLKLLINRLHRLGYSVRFSCILLKGLIDQSEEVGKMADFASRLGVEQLSLRPVVKTVNSENEKVSRWVGQNMLSEKQVEKIRSFLDKEGKRLVTYGHGSAIYDYHGQNICLTNALTLDSGSEDIRQLIYFPDGHLRFDWQYKGAIIL